MLPLIYITFDYYYIHTRYLVTLYIVHSSCLNIPG